MPFYLRSGKAMSCRTTQIVVQFHEPPHMLFQDGPRAFPNPIGSSIQVQPDEGMQLQFETKVPDAGMKLRQTALDFRYQREFRGMIPEAYERLLLDALEGDASLFARADEVEAAWRLRPDYRLVAGNRPAHAIRPGDWGPPESADWMAEQGRQWFDTCPVFIRLGGELFAISTPLD